MPMKWLREREYANKNDYLAYYKETKSRRETPLTYAQWLKLGTRKTVRTAVVETQLSRAGISPKEIAKLRIKNVH